MKVLLVEDDESITQLLMATLTEQNYRVDVARDGQAGWELVEAFPYDLVVLDVMLPRLDGISFCRKLRSHKNEVPVLLLTARETSHDKQIGLDAGADDYVVKPFDPQELTARIRALLRRGNRSASPILSFGKLQLDPSSHEVTYDQQPLKLSRKEYELLELLLRNKTRIFSRSAILDRLWSFDEPPGEDTVKAHIKRVRQKLKTVAAEDLIETLYGQGYRLNPAYEKEERSPTPESQPSSQQATRAMVAQIWERTRSTALDRLSALEQATQVLKQSALDEELRCNAEQNAHKLLGSLGTFGMVEGSSLARQLEALWGANTPRGKAEIRQIQTLVTQLRQVIEAGVTSPIASPFSEEVGTAQTPPAVAASNDPLLLIVDDDRTLTDYLTAAAPAWNVRTAIASDLAMARSIVRQTRPDAVLLDRTLSDNPEDGLTLLTELTAASPPIPVLIFSARDQLSDRMAVARLGAKVFLQKPTTADQVFQAVKQVLQQFHPSDARILAVDDDPQLLQALAALLEPWGIQLFTLTDPLQFWETLETAHPDLLILDIDMPHLSGIELCQAVRNDPRWSWLPILFLSAKTGADVVYQVFEVGADDYVAKPIAPPELISRLFNRLERTRLLRSQAETDLLTGVLNRQRATQELEQFLQHAKLSEQPVSLGLLELENLRKLNAQHGHAGVDRALRQVAQLLKQKLRREDVVARWSGAEFVVGLYGVLQQDGIEWLAEILETLREMEFVASDDTLFSVSLTAGIAQFPTDGTDLAMLYRSADAALYQAKQAGGDRIHPVGWKPLAESATHIDIALIYPADRPDDVATPIMKALETRGYHARWFDTGEKAMIALIGSHPTLQANLLILADPLPDMNAFHLLDALRNKGVQRSLVLLSEPAHAQPAIDRGAVDYVVMPCNLPVLMQRISALSRT